MVPFVLFYESFYFAYCHILANCVIARIMTRSCVRALNSPYCSSDLHLSNEQCLIKRSYIIWTHHSFLPDDRHPVLHTVHPVRDLGEVVFTQGLLAHREGAVVCSRHTEIIASTIDREIRRYE